MSKTRPETVALVRRTGASYPLFPFLPDESYPELDGRVPVGSAPNDAFAMVRDAFRHLGLDSDRYGSPAWNPLCALVRPGSRVVLKPNWVREFNAGLSDDVACMYTHPAVIRAVLEYVFLALSGSGSVVIADAPLQSCNLPLLLDDSGVSRLVGHLAADDKRVEIRDLRLTLWREGTSAGDGDPIGYTYVDLGSESLHASRDERYRRYRVSCYDPALMRRRHAPGRHEYLVANTILDADLVIDMPKLKTHKKAGMTGALKNYVGIVGHKEFLPHHVKGSPREGGDEYDRPSVLKAVHSELVDVLYGPVVSRVRPLRYAANQGVLALRSLMRSGGSRGVLDGSWMGNDTLWRTILDLARVVRYYDRELGGMRTDPVRRELVVVDAIVTGEGEGPLAPDPHPSGTIAASLSPAATDLALTRFIGFDPKRIALIEHAFDLDPWPLADRSRVEVVTAVDGAHSRLSPEEVPVEPHVPPSGWDGISSYRSAHSTPGSDSCAVFDG